MLRWIERLLVLFIFLIPWNARVILRPGILNSGFWEYGTVAVYATDVLFFAIIVSTLIAVAKKDLRFQVVDFKIFVYCLLFTIYTFLSILWSFDKLVAFYAALKLFEGIVLFFLIRILPINREKLIWAFIANAVIQSVLAIMQFFTQSVFTWPFSGIAPQDPSDLGVSVVQFADERWLRSYGSFPHPNLLGAFLVIALLLMTWQIVKIKSKKIFFASSYVLVVSGLFFTFSRAAWIAFFVGFIVYAVQTKAWKEKIFLQFTLLLVVIATILTTLFFPLVRTRIGGGARLEIQSNQERTTGYREAAQLIQRHPFFGVGIGNYTSAVARELRSNDSVWSYQPAHNVFLLILSELGIVGLLLFLFIFKKLRVTGYGLLIPIVILALFDHSLWTLHAGILLLWFALAFIDNNLTAE